MSEEQATRSLSAAKAARRAAIAVAPVPAPVVSEVVEADPDITAAAPEAAVEAVETVAEPVAGAAVETVEAATEADAVSDVVETVSAAVEELVAQDVADTVVEPKAELVEATASAPEGVAPEAVAAGSAFAEKVALKIKALADASTSLTLGMQEASRTWLAATQGGMKLQREGFSKLAVCRTPLDLMTAQGELALRGLERAAKTGESIVRTSTRAIEAAGRALQT